jgi:hypothetical protein
MSGGIIINRLKILLTAVTHSCIYDSLSSDVRAQVDEIKAKGPGEGTAEDVSTLAGAIASVCNG